MQDTKPAWLREAESKYERGLLLGRALGEVYRRENPSEPYVSIPPAFMITDHDGATWTFGHEYRETRWSFEMNVLRNDVNVGQFAEKIEFRGGKVYLYGRDGRRVASRSRRHIL